MKTSPQIKGAITSSISFKLGVIFLLILIMQIPLSYVSDLIYQRQHLQRQAHHNIAKRWGSDQYIGTPLLSIETTRQKRVKNDRLNHVSVTEKYDQTYQSAATQVDIKLEAQKRYLGIYEAAVYQSQISMSGQLAMPTEKIEAQNKWSLFVPVKRLKGLKKINKISINGQVADLEPVQKTLNNMTGLVFDLTDFKSLENIDYDIELTLIGTEQLMVFPSARTTAVNIQSNWPSPSFIGDYLPDQRVITDDGFSAQWQVNNMLQSEHSEDVQSSDGFPVGGMSQEMLEHYYGTFGVKVMIAANVYQVNERSVKYSFLIVLLSFAAFFLAELFFQLRLHPFHYLMIGVSLSVFYLLLLSISEFLYFNVAFLIAASAITVMISAYCTVVLKQRKRGLLTGVFFALLYGFIFVLIKAEETSLLMGSIAIWLIVAVIMYLTRKIDWYNISITDKNSETTELAD